TETHLDRVAVSPGQRVRPGRLAGAIDDPESLRQRGDVGSVLGVEPRDPGSLVAGREAGAGEDAPELEVVVAGEHVDRLRPKRLDRLDGARPDRRRGRDAGNDDRIARPRSTPV